jgi:hypothetical protein
MPSRLFSLKNTIAIITNGPTTANNGNGTAAANSNSTTDGAAAAVALMTLKNPSTPKDSCERPCEHEK